MKPIIFKEKNKILLKPSNMTEEECGSLYVFADEKECISCWRPSFIEKISILLFGKVWLFVFSGGNQPATAIQGARTVFRKK